MRSAIVVRSVVAYQKAGFMQARIAQMGAAIVAVLFALVVARTEAFAASSQESCSTTSTNVDLRNPDGTEAICQADIGPPNKATAHASDQALASSGTADGSTAKSSASGVGAAAVADAGDGGIATATASGENAQAAGGAASGSTKAIAKGGNSNAFAAIDYTDGGKATATATGGAQATALIPSAGGGSAVATARDAAEAFALVSNGGGKATSISSGSGSSAVADVVDGGVAKASAIDGGQAGAVAGAMPPGHQPARDSTAAKCKATAISSGAGGNAEAVCENPGSVVTAVASKGSIAIGSDTTAPTCTPMNGGVAKVRSPMGDCD